MSTEMYRRRIITDRADLILEALAQRQQKGTPSPARITLNGDEVETSAFLLDLRSDRRDAWPSLAKEYKLEAVKLIKDRGVSYAQAAEDLGVHPTQLREWVKKLADDPQHAFPGQGQMKPEQQEITRLRREVAKLKAERDILKKAAVDSTGECNMIDLMLFLEGYRGATGPGSFIHQSGD
jgi:transposase